MEEVDQEFQQLSQEISKSTQEFNEKVQKKIDEVQKIVRSRKEIRESFEADMRTIEEEIKKSMDNVRQMKTDQKSQSEAKRNHEEQLQRLNDELQTYPRQIDQLQTKMTILNLKKERLSSADSTNIRDEDNERHEIESYQALYGCLIEKRGSSLMISYPSSVATFQISQTPTGYALQSASNNLQSEKLHKSISKFSSDGDIFSLIESNWPST